MLHTKFRGNWSAGSGEEDFWRVFTIWAATWENRIFACAKTKTQISFAVTAKLISAFVFATWIVQSLYFLNPKFRASSHLLWFPSPACVGPGRKPRRPVFWRRGSIIWAWWPFWSCDPDAANKLSFPLPKEAPHKIWLWLAKRFRRRRCLKMWTDGGRRTDDGRRSMGILKAHLWAFGSGELNMPLG